MRGAFLLLAALAWPAHAEPLTLEAALAAARAHPERRIAEAELEIARAEREQMDSRLDWSLSLDGSLAGGRRPGADWKPDNVARLVARKPLYDFGRTGNSLGAAGEEVTARAALLTDADSAARLRVMARFFDVLLADLRYAADNEATEVAYFYWDTAQDRFETGQVARQQVLALEAAYQDARERRSASESRMRTSRQALANAMNQPESLAAELAPPRLVAGPVALPDRAVLKRFVEAGNPRLGALRAQIAASEARLSALRAERLPVIEAELVGAGYSREATTRDDVRLGLAFSVPLYQGARIDARIARELAAKQRTQAQYEATRLELLQTLGDTLEEIDWLASSAIPAADKGIEARDWALERARAEYELELKTNLGSAMADTQNALLRRRTADYRLALALARLEVLAGGSLPAATNPPVAQAAPSGGQSSTQGKTP